MTCGAVLVSGECVLALMWVRSSEVIGDSLLLFLSGGGCVVGCSSGTVSVGGGRQRSGGSRPAFK